MRISKVSFLTVAATLAFATPAFAQQGVLGDWIHGSQGRVYTPNGQVVNGRVVNGQVVNGQVVNGHVIEPRPVLSNGQIWNNGQMRDCIERVNRMGQREMICPDGSHDRNAWLRRERERQAVLAREAQMEQAQMARQARIEREEILAQEQARREREIEMSREAQMGRQNEMIREEQMAREAQIARQHEIAREQQIARNNVRYDRGNGNGNGHAYGHDKDHHDNGRHGDHDGR